MQEIARRFHFSWWQKTVDVKPALGVEKDILIAECREILRNGRLSVGQFDKFVLNFIQLLGVEKRYSIHNGDMERSQRLVDGEHGVIFEFVYEQKPKHGASSGRINVYPAWWFLPREERERARVTLQEPPHIESIFLKRHSGLIGIEKAFPVIVYDVQRPSLMITSFAEGTEVLIQERRDPNGKFLPASRLKEICQRVVQLYEDQVNVSSQA